MATYYSTLTAYVKSLGLTKVFGNSGADVPYYFVGSVDTIGYFENNHQPPLSVLGGWHTQYNKANFAFFAYNVTTVNPYYIATASDYVNYLYLTSGTRPHPYNSLPSYFDQLVADLDSLVPVTIETHVPNGNLVSRGFQVTVTQPDGTTSTGYTPSTFDVVSGSTVRVSVENNRGYVFEHWDNGSTNQTIVPTATKATTLVAYSRTLVSNASLVTIHTAEPDGTPVTGIWTIASVNGTMVAGGYTPFTFVATRGLRYSIAVSDYGSYSFDSWADGKRDHNTTIVPNGDELLKAYFLNSTTAHSPFTGIVPESRWSSVQPSRPALAENIVGSPLCPCDDSPWLD